MHPHHMAVDEQISRVGQTVQSWARPTVGDITPDVVVVAAFRVGEYLVVFCRDTEGQKAFDEVYETKIHFLKILCERISQREGEFVLGEEVLCSRRMFEHGHVVLYSGLGLHELHSVRAGMWVVQYHAASNLSLSSVLFSQGLSLMRACM
jgi:hypothetical protein